MYLEKKFITKDGRDAAVLVNDSLGFRCGYVALKNEDLCLLDNKIDVANDCIIYCDYFLEGIECHGGITFSSKTLENSIYEEIFGKDVIILGFDCGHSADRCDENLLKAEFKPIARVLSIFEFGEIRTLKYCIEQCEKISEQIEEKLKSFNI